MITPEVLGRTLAEAPDPELARVALSRVGEDPGVREVLGRPDVLPAAARLLGFSTAAADFLVAHPEEAEAVLDLRPRSGEELAAELTRDVARLGAREGLRRFRRRAMLRVGARDLAGATYEDVVAEITAVAQACLAEACRAEAPEGGLAVIGLGKLGGAELNYSSDVDVIFVHGGVGAARQHRVEGEAARIIRLLSEPTAEGIALRVDASLRPGGRGGPLSRSVESTLDHYARHAETWERQALLKARPVAGDLDLGREFVERVTPFVYPAELPPQAIEDVRQTKVRIEEYVRARGKEAVEVKRGRGGIRDVEFAVQLLQMVHGRRDGRLREPNTLRALAVLAEEGYVARADAEALAGAYRFLRRLEHRLQMARDLQTHELPTDRPSLSRVARAMGLGGPEALRDAYERETELVRGLHERLFYRPMLEAFAGPPTPRPGLDREAIEELLGGLGFRRPQAAYEVLDGLVDPATRLGKVLSHLFPVLGPALALAPVPDAALVRLDRVAGGLKERADLADALAGDPPLARRLAEVAGVSSFATDLLAANPDLVPALAGTEEDPDPTRGLLSVVGRYASRQLDVEQTGRALTRVAERVLGQAVEAAEPDLPFAVIGLGRLGAEELTFASDLDVVFVYEGEGPGVFERAGRVAERVLAAVRDAGWEPDPDLRPEGKNGPLARSVAAFLEYWERWARTWEFQTLLRARYVAGDEALGRRFELLAQDFAYPEDLPLEAVAEIRRMRVRWERERVRPAGATRFHFKLGRGSLADVQFAVELSLMRHGGAHPEVRRRRTPEAVEALLGAGLIEDGVARALHEGFVFLSNVKGALEVERRLPAEAIPSTPEEQLALARRLGYEEYPRHAFLEDYRRVTRRVRQAMERVFYGEEG